MRGLYWLRLAIVLSVWAARSAIAATGSVDYTYDDAGRLRTGTFSDGTVVDYQYDPAGNRTVMTMGVPGQLAIAAPTSNASEGNALLFRVTRTGATLQDVTVSCVPTDGSAVAGGSDPYNDYTTTPQTVTFLTTDADPITKNCSIATRNDSYYVSARASAVLRLS